MAISNKWSLTVTGEIKKVCVIVKNKKSSWQCPASLFYPVFAHHKMQVVMATGIVCLSITLQSDQRGLTRGALLIARQLKPAICNIALFMG